MCLPPSEHSTCTAPKAARFLSEDGLVQATTGWAPACEPVLIQIFAREGALGSCSQMVSLAKVTSRFRVLFGVRLFPLDLSNAQRSSTYAEHPATACCCSAHHTSTAFLAPHVAFGLAVDATVTIINCCRDLGMECFWTLRNQALASCAAGGAVVNLRNTYAA